MTKTFFARLLLFSAVAALSAPVTAQRVDNIVAFGDSYADDGNAFQLGLIPAQLLPLYPTQRFTGGANYVDVLSELLDAPVENFAIGGATANPVFLFEVGTYMAGGGGVFPLVSPTLDEGDLVTVSIGGNDARAYGSLPGASVAGAAAASVPAVAATTAGLDTLVDAGASTISFLAGDTGELPEVAANPAVAAIRTAYSTAFNQGVQGALAGYAADGVIVHYLDLSALLANVEADPQAYGLSSITCPAFPDPTCVLNGGAGYLFYGDLLHPTSQGSAIIAHYIATQLNGPLILQGPSETALATGFQFGRTLRNRADVARSPAAAGIQGIEWFAIGDAFSRDLNETDSADEGDINGGGGTIGMSYRFGNAVAGVAGNYSRVRTEFSRNTARSKMSAWQIGAFAGFAGPNLFAEGHVGYGKDDHDLRRAGVVEDLDASPDGSHWVAGAKAGYLIDMTLPLLGAMRAGPVGAVEYVKAKVDDYAEEGDAVLNLNVSSVTAKSFVGSIGAEVRRSFGEGPGALQVFSNTVIEKEMSGNADTVHFAQQSAPIIVNRWDFQKRSRKAYARFSTGGSVRVLDGLGLDFLISSTTGRKDGLDLSAQVGLRTSF